MNLSDRFNKNPKSVLGVNWTFSEKSSNPILCGHLDKYHRKAYYAFCEANDCENQLPSFKQAKSKEAQNLGSTQVAQRQVRFTMPQFTRHIVDFIVADEQVHKCKVMSSLLPTDTRAIPVLKGCGMARIP